jgi:hypothetical protein
VDLAEMVRLEQPAPRAGLVGSPAGVDLVAPSQLALGPWASPTLILWIITQAMAVMAVQVGRVEMRCLLVPLVALEELAVWLAMEEKGVPFTPRRPLSLWTALSQEILPVELAQLTKVAMGAPEGWDWPVLMIPRLAMVEQAVTAVQEEERYRPGEVEPFLLILQH